MDYDIHQIKIMLDMTNGKKVDDKTNENDKNKNDNTFIELRSDILRFEKTSNYELTTTPHIATNVMFNASKLMSNLKTYEKIVQFFFNKKYMKKKLAEMGITPTTNISNDNIPSFVTMNNNVNVMLSLLFQTTFPVQQNNDNSFDKYLMQTQPSFMTMIKNNNGYTQLKIGGAIYTVTHTTWLNDFVNHPVYRMFLNKYTNYLKWSTEQSTLLKNSIIKKIKLIYEKYEINNDDVENFNKINTTSQQIVISFKNKIGELIINFKNAKPIITNDVLNTDDKTTSLMDNFDKLYEIIHDVMELTNNRVKINIPKKMQQKIKKIYESANDVYNYKVITEKYITTNNNIQVNYENEEKEIQSLLKKYDKFIEFSKSIKNVTEPVRISTNNELQTTINEFGENKNDTDKNNIKNLMSYTNDKFIDGVLPKVRIDEKLLNVGVCVINMDVVGLPKYEIHVALDLVKGELNDENVKMIKCKYMDNYMVNEFETQIGKLNKHDVNEHRIVVSLNDNKKGGRKTRKNKKNIM